MAEHAADRALVPVQHEAKDVRLGFILKLFGLIGGVLILLIGLATWLFPGELADRRFAGPFPDYPVPRLQQSPPAEMRAFYASEMKQLNSAGWIDQAQGVVRIPIDQAMADVAREGIAGWPSPQGAKH